MNFQIKILLLSFLLTVVLSVFIIPILRKLKIGQIERTDGPQSHLKKEGTPTMGGIIMALILIIMSVGLYYYYRVKEPQVANTIIPLALVSIGFSLIGFVDDIKKLVFNNTKGLSPKSKMIGLLFISVIFSIFMAKFTTMSTGLYIPVLKTTIILPFWIYIPFAVFVMLGATNALNLTDGVDGLATSISTIIITTLVVIGLIFGAFKGLTVFGSILIGSCLGFLLFNLYPAKIMMGDTGSFLLGGAIVAMALYMQIPLVLILVAIIPIAETLSVMIQVAHYKRTGNRVFKMAPLHHHFELSGWNENKVVSIFSIITLILSIIAIYTI